MPKLKTDELEASCKLLLLELGFLGKATLLREMSSNVVWDTYVKRINESKDQLTQLKVKAIATGKTEALYDEMFKYYCLIKGLIAQLNRDVSRQQIKNRSCMIYLISSLFPPEPVIDNATIKDREKYINEKIDYFCKITQQVLNPTPFEQISSKAKVYCNMI